MSLLLDALKRAEADRLARADSAGGMTAGISEPRPTLSKEVSLPGAETLSLAEIVPRQSDDVATSPSPQTPLSDAENKSIEVSTTVPKAQSKPIRTEAPASARATSQQSSQAATLRGREQAQSLFAAKAPTATRREVPLIPIAGGIALLVAALGAAYVWYSLNKLTKPAPSAFAPQASYVPPTPIAGTKPVEVAAPSTPSTLPAATPNSAESTPRNIDPRVPVTTPPPPAQPTLPLAAKGVVAPIIAAAAPPQTPPEKSASQTTVSPRESARVTLKPTRLEPNLVSGYAALARGDLNAAERSYRNALQDDASNVDSRLGLAYIAGQRGDRTTALQQYRAVLALEPTNATARAGLAALTARDLPALANEEAALRAEIARATGGSGDSSLLAAPLQAALGSVLASEARWSEAQAAYYEAFRGDPGNPDVLYNLAVSLDQLKQTKLAADFYARALTAAQARPAQFDLAAANRRLTELR